MAPHRYIVIWPGGAFFRGPATAGAGGPVFQQLHAKWGELLPEGVAPAEIDQLLRSNLIRVATRWDGVLPEPERETVDE